MVDFYSKNKWVGVTTSVLLIANIITLTMLWIGNRHPESNIPLPPPPDRSPAFEFVVKELSMDEHQQKKYKALRDEHHQQQKPLGELLAKAKDDYFSLLKDSTVSDSILLQQSSRQMAVMQQIELINFRHFQKVRSICNATQQQKFDSIIQEVLKRFARQHPPLREGDRGMRPQGNPDHFQSTE